MALTQKKVLAPVFILPVILCLALVAFLPGAFSAEKKQSLQKEEDTSYIVIESKSAREVFEDAEHLRSLGKYGNLLPLYNYAYDIARDKKLRKKILIARKAEERRIRREKKKKIDGLYKEALSYYSANQLDRAAKVFKEILSVDPDQRKAKRYLDRKIPSRRAHLQKIENKKKKRKKKR